MEKPIIHSGAWHHEKQLELKFPEKWDVHILKPDNAPQLTKNQIEQAFDKPIDTKSISQLAKGKNSAAVAVDDITRPTPVHRFLSRIIAELEQGGIPPDKIKIIIGTAAHRPMNKSEMVKKLGNKIVERFCPIIHDFTGPDIQFVGWINGGPVYINRHFVQADLKICVGNVMPHGEMGFGGGAKMVVPGLAGRYTIAHFHGALSPRTIGQLKTRKNICDRRTWATQVARHIGIDAVVCTVVNSKRQLAGIFVGDLEKAHLAAAKKAAQIGRTCVPKELAAKIDLVIANAYPLDTDPIQMGKTLSVATKVKPNACIVIINAASDGLFYHGMGMGCGISFKRLFRNLLACISNPKDLSIWAKSMRTAIKSPINVARLCYFSLNYLPYSRFLESQSNPDSKMPISITNKENSKFFVYSEKFPAWGFKQKYPKASLYTDWRQLIESLTKRFDKATVVVLPVAPLQLVEFA